MDATNKREGSLNIFPQSKVIFEKFSSQVKSLFILKRGSNLNAFKGQTFFDGHCEMYENILYGMVFQSSRVST